MSSLEEKIETLIGEEAMASLYYRAGDNILQELVALIQEEIEAAQQELIDELGGIDLTIANELVALMNKKNMESKPSYKEILDEGIVEDDGVNFPE